MGLRLQETVRCRAAAPILCLLVFVWMCLTVSDPGITWDETFYLGYAVRYGTWFRAATGHAPQPEDSHLAPPPVIEDTFARPFDSRVLRYWWGIDRISPDSAALGQKHPPLGKLVSYAAIWPLPFFDYVTAARLGSAALFALLCWCVFALADWRCGRTAAVFSVLALLAMPRLVTHMRLATLEPALLLTTVFAFYAFLKAQDSKGWAAVCGVAFGVALLAKVNALAILPVAGLWALLFQRRADASLRLLGLWAALCLAGAAAFLLWPPAVALPLALAPFGLLFLKRKACLPLVSMAVLGPLVFVAGWPALWREPVGGAVLYLQDKFMDRSLIPAFYWGRAYVAEAAPWHFAPVMFLATTPLLILAAVGAGVARAWRERREAPERFRTDALMALAAGAHVLAATASPAARADGVRMMLSAFPFVAILAGRGGAWAWEGLKAWGRARPRTAALLPAAAAIWALIPHAALHPFGLSYYNELVGGPWGAHAAGMETTYWFDAFDRRAAAFLNQHAPEGARVAYLPDPEGIHHWNQIAGRLRPDLRLTQFAHDWDCLVVISRRSWIENPADPDMARLRKLMAEEPPAWTGYLTGLRRMPVCRIYMGGG